jgi:hypothetical protein
MIRRSWIASLMVAALAAVLMFPPTPARSASPQTATVTITAHVDAFAEWAVASHTITAANFDHHITGMSSTATASHNMVIYANTDLSLTSAAADANAGQLTGASTSLTTQYNLTAAAAGLWLGAATALDDPTVFFGRTYALDASSAAGVYTLVLTVTATPQSGSAPAVGDYTCDINIIASWI